MPLYEHVFLARQDISVQQVEGLIETFKSIITEQGGKISKTEYWGLKNLAYKIKRKRKSHYALMNIDADHKVVAEMERQMRIEDDIVRFLTIRVDQHEDEPSAMMKRHDRHDRHDRDDRRGPRHDRDERQASRAKAKKETPTNSTAAAEKQNEAAAPSTPGEAAASKKGTT